MSDDGELNVSGVYMPNFFPEPLTLSSKKVSQPRRDVFMSTDIHIAESVNGLCYMDVTPIVY